MMLTSFAGQQRHQGEYPGITRSSKQRGAVFSQDRRRSAPTRAFVDFLRERLEGPDQDSHANERCEALVCRPGKYAAAPTPTAPILSLIHI